MNELSEVVKEQAMLTGVQLVNEATDHAFSMIANKGLDTVVSVEKLKFLVSSLNKIRVKAFVEKDQDYERIVEDYESLIAQSMNIQELVSLNQQNKRAYDMLKLASESGLKVAAKALPLIIAGL